MCILNIHLRKFLLAPGILEFKYWVSRGESAYQIQTTNVQHKMEAIRGERQSSGVWKMTFSKEADIQIIIVVKFLIFQKTAWSLWHICVECKYVYFLITFCVKSDLRKCSSGVWPGFPLQNQHIWNIRLEMRWRIQSVIPTLQFSKGKWNDSLKQF